MPRDLIYSSAPINRTAAVVTGGGTSWDPRMKPADHHQTFGAPPLPLKPPPNSAIDYVGVRRGKLAAFRYYGKRVGGKSLMWVCRCDCGNYELRAIAPWSKGDSPDACRPCRAAWFAKYGYSFGCGPEEATRKAAYRRLQQAGTTTG